MTPVAFSANATRAFDKLVAPSFRSRFAHQFFTHSAHAPVTLLILEWLLAGPAYFAEPDGYVLIATALVQAAVLARLAADAPAWQVALANLVGVALYTLVESPLEGADFFVADQHIAYWGIAIAFAALQGARRQINHLPAPRDALLLVEAIARSAIPVLLYAVFEARSEKIVLSPAAFFSDPAHDYLTIVVLLLGVLLGVADRSRRRAIDALRHLGERLHQLSSWSFGSQVVAETLQDAGRVALRRQERALLFMDIRGFTAWSEAQAPEAVVTMLNNYYRASEHCLTPLAPIKIKYTGDEVMAVFADKAQALIGARRLQQVAATALRPHGLHVGIGLHAGPVVEGLLGGDDVKAYDCIGDVVNTASRLCAAAQPGELLVSDSLAPAPVLNEFPQRRIDAKGKRDALAVRVLAPQHATAAG